MTEELNNQNTGTETQGQEQNETKDQNTITMTKDELDALIQRTSDSRVSQALKTQERKLKEAEKLARMSETEKYEYELQQREKAIEEKEKQLTLAENKNTVAKILNEKGLSLSLVDFCVDEDADVMNKNIQTLEKAFKASVKAEVEKRLGKGGQPENHNADNKTLTKEDFKKMSLAQMQELHDTDPELYDLLKK